MENKISIKEINRINKYYEKKREELNELLVEVRAANSMIDLSEVEKLSYSEVNELVNNIILRIEDEEVANALKKIRKTKREEQYPELLDAHYYPILRNLNLSKENRVSLDKKLCELVGYISFRKDHIFKDIKILDEEKEEILSFLLDNGILVKHYVFECNCDPFKCSSEYISEEDRKEFYKYHNFDYDNATDEEIDVHEENFSKGYFSIGCWNNGEVEIYDIESFEENLKGIEYRVKILPDKTLDNI